MKEFFRSYNNEVWKPYLNWQKNHWKGIVILNLGIMTVEAGLIYGGAIKEKIQDKIEERRLKHSK